MYARPRRALEVNGIGPFSFDGSRPDSGACFHTRVQDRSARLRTMLVFNYESTVVGLEAVGQNSKLPLLMLTRFCSIPRLAKLLSSAA